MKSGKSLEIGFRKSVPEDVFFYRFRDGTSSWDRGNKTRFQAYNIADCELFYKGKLFILELKSTKGSSLPYKNIRQKQIEELTKASEYENIICGFVIDFSELNECYFIKISQFNEFLKTADRVSIPIKYLRENGIKIDVRVLRTNKRYDIENLLAVK